MRPAVEVHDVPERFGVELGEVGDDGDEDAADAFVVQRAGEMMMVDEVTPVARAEHHRDHVMGEEISEALCAARFPRFALARDFAHPESHLGRTQVEHGSRVQGRFMNL